MTKNKDLVETKPGFDLTVKTGSDLTVPADLELVETDYEGFEESQQFMPIVSIRQKDLKNDLGSLIVGAGGFRIYDVVSTAANQPIPDVGGAYGLTVTVISDQTSRVYFESMDDDHPKCRSNNGKTGIAEPAGTNHCGSCPLSQFKDGETPKCKQQVNLLVYDYKMDGCYILRFGPSGLKPYGNFKAGVSRMKPRLPVSALTVNVKSVYKAEPQPHYVPELKIVEVLDGALFQKIREFRDRLTSALTVAAEVQKQDNQEDGAGEHSAF